MLVPTNDAGAIPDNAFHSVPILRHLSVAERPHTIGAAVWQSCHQLQVVKLPETVVCIERAVFLAVLSAYGPLHGLVARQECEMRCSQKRPCAQHNARWGNVHFEASLRIFCKTAERQHVLQTHTVGKPIAVFERSTAMRICSVHRPVFLGT